LQVLLQERELQQLQQQGSDAAANTAADADAAADGDDGDGASEGSKQQQSSPLRALILAPTRELALQVRQIGVGHRC
jgi:superfamily II DNA/RNA helicase